DAWGGLESPAMLAHVRMDDGHADDVLEPFQRAQDHDAIGPWASQRHIYVIAAGLGLETAAPGWPGAAVRRDPMPELGVAAHEASPCTSRVIPLILPLAIDKQAHLYLLVGEASTV